MKSTTKHIVFALMIVLLVTTLIVGIVVLGRMLDFFKPADNTQVSDQPSGDGNGPINDSANVPGHIHEYVKDKDFPASCDGSGYTLYICACGKADIRDLTNPLGHTFSDYNTVPATCESDGYTERICSRCQYPERTNLVPASHAFGDWMPSSTAPQEVRTCAACELTEIRSTDFEQTWVLRLPYRENIGRYSLQEVILETEPNAEAQVFQMYLDEAVIITGYDYADTIVSVFYTANGISGDCTLTADAVTIHADGSFTPGAPAVEEPTPEPGPEPATEPETE